MQVKEVEVQQGRGEQIKEVLDLQNVQLKMEVPDVEVVERVLERRVFSGDGEAETVYIDIIK